MSLTTVDTKPTTTQKPRRVKKAAKKHSAEASKQAHKRVELDKKIFFLQERLIDENVEESVLKDAAALFQPQQYLDVVEERAADMCCGYPCCRNKLTPSKGTVPKYKLSLATKRVYDNSELRMYCSPVCLVASKLYAEQLSTIPAYLRTAEDLQSAAQIKLANDIKDSEDPPPNPSIHESVIDTVHDLLLPYGNGSTDLNKLQAQISVQERVDIAPPSLDFSSSQKKRLPPVTSSPSSKNTSLDGTTTATQTKNNSTTTITSTKNDQTELTQQLTNLTIVDNKPPNNSSLNGKSNGKTKKRVQFKLNSDNQTPPDSPTTNSHNSTASDDEDMSLFGMQDSSDDEPLILSLSSFGTLWTALDNWCSPATIKFLHPIGDVPLETTNTEEDEELQYSLPNNAQHALRRQALYGSLSPHVAQWRSVLQCSYAIEQDLVPLIDTFAMTQTVPSFSAIQWKTLALLFIDLLSLQSPTLAKQIRSFKNNKSAVLSSIQVNEDEYNVFLDIFSLQPDK